MYDGTGASHREDIASVSPPNTMQVFCGAAVHWAPGGAVIVHDSAGTPHREDIAAVRPPNTVQVLRGAAAH